MGASTFIPPLVSGNPAFPYIPLGSINYDYVELDVSAPGIALTGTVSIDMTATSPAPTTLIGVGTQFESELVINDYISWNNGVTGATQVLAQVVAITDDFELIIGGDYPIPIGGASIYGGVPLEKINTAALIAFDLLADPSQVSVNVPAVASRFYYNQFVAWDWNTNSLRDLATEYATANTGDLRDLGWSDEASWQAVINTLLTFGGWNVTITKVIPDTTTINNLNQEIVVYYQNSNHLYNGVNTDAVQQLVFYEQSPSANNYKQIIGVNPFDNSEVYFDGRDYGGVYFNTAGGTTPGRPTTPVLADVATNVVVGSFSITYNETAATIRYTDQNLTQGQLQVFVKYTTYDGVESVAAKELVAMGISVNPENVSWYLKELGRDNGVAEIEWPFDDTDEAPKQDEPQNFDPLSESPLDFTPPNAKVEGDEENAD